jgi:hypothetical protein
MIPHTGLPAWPTTSDEERGRPLRRTRGCCPGHPRATGETQVHLPAPARKGGDGATHPPTRHHRCAVDGRQGRPRQISHRSTAAQPPSSDRRRPAITRGQGVYRRSIEGIPQPSSSPRQEGSPPPPPRPVAFARRRRREVAKVFWVRERGCGWERVRLL